MELHILANPGKLWKTIEKNMLRGLEYFFFCHTLQDLFFPLAMISEDFGEHDFDLLDFSEDL